MNRLYISRTLKMNNFELFKIQQKRFDEILGYLAFIDFNRPSTLKDFPYLQGIETDDEFGKSNFIKAICISHSDLSLEHKSFLEAFTDSFIGNKEDCDWNIDFIENQMNFSNLSIDVLISLYKQLLKINYDINLNIVYINPKSFNHLSQY